MTMNIHDIAEECAEFYLSEIVNHHVSHSENVKKGLRKIVEYWTKKCLSKKDEEEEEEYDGNWKDEIIIIEEEERSLGEEQDKVLELSTRSKCRMEAFLAGCSYALPNDPFPMTTTTKGTTTSTAGISTNSHTSYSVAASLQKSIQKFVGSNPISRKKDIISSNGSSSTSSSSSSVHNTENDNPSKMNNNLKNDHLSNTNQNIVDSSASSTSSSKRVVKSIRRNFPQIHVQDLTLRLEIYLRSLRRLRAQNSNSNNSQSKQQIMEECLLACEPTRYLKARVDLVVQAFIATVSCVHSMRPTLTNLLRTMTQELLAVPVLAEELVQVSIPNIVTKYEHLTSFASLAFLSTPEHAAHQLYQIILQYVEFLSSDWSRHVQSCYLELMLSTTIPSKLRMFFKNIEFSSIGHLLEICRQQSAALESVPLQRLTTSTDRHSEKQTLKQAMKDLRREGITVNSHVLPPVTSYKELCRNLTEALNSRTMTLRHQKYNKTNQKSKTSTDDSPSPVTSGTESDYHSRLRKMVSEYDKDPTKYNDTNSPNRGDDDLIFSSGNEGDTDDIQQNQHAATRKGHHVRGRRFGVDTIDLMTKRLLIAASRTGIGGDAYFVVRDLFGGEGVNVVPSSSVASFSSPHYEKYDTDGNYTKVTRRRGTIELIVRLATVTIKCHSRYDVYPDNLSRFDEHHDEPLITLHTTTTENIYLQEVRVNEDGTELLTAEQCENATNQKHTMIMLKEKKTPLSGNRNLSIRPAKYEKVFDYHTPS